MCKLNNTSDNPPCSNTVTVTISTCGLTASANPININAGQSSILSYSGCTGGSVTWDNGAGSGNNISVLPAITTEYTAICNPSGGGTPCSASVTVNVATPCSITVSANPNNIFMGQSSTLSATGYLGTVFWDNNLGNGENKPLWTESP